MGFVSIHEPLMLEMSALSANAHRLFTILLQNLTRKYGQREPTEETKQFRLSYQDFVKYKIPRSSYTDGIVELREKGFIKVTGERYTKMCRMLKW